MTTVSLNPTRIKEEAIKACLLVFAVLLFSLVMNGCQDFSRGDVEAAFTTELVACVTSAQTREQSKVCRRAVYSKYGLCEHPDASPPVVPCE
jgi:hypothetical protein